MDKSLEKELSSTSTSMSETRSSEPNNNHPCQSVALTNVDTSAQGRVSVYTLPSNDNSPTSQPAPEITGELESLKIELKQQYFGSPETIPQVNKNTAPVSNGPLEKNKDLKTLQSLRTVRKKKQKTKYISPVGFGHTEERTSSKSPKCDLEKSQQSQEIFTTIAHTLSPERNTQTVCEEVKECEEVTGMEIEIDTETNSTEDPTIILSDEEKEVLLMFLCYHSFELLDFRDDVLWQNLMKKKEFKHKSWKVYKKQFLDNLVNSMHGYHIPYYFSDHMRQKYGTNSKSSFSCEKLGKSKKCWSKTNNDSTSCEPSRRNIVDLDIFSSDEDKESRTCKKHDQKHYNNMESMNKSSSSKSKSRTSRNKLKLLTSSHNSTDKTQSQDGKNYIKDKKSSEKENSGDSFDCYHIGENNLSRNEMKTLETKYSFLQNLNISPNNSTYKPNVPQKTISKVTLNKSDLHSSDNDTPVNQIKTSQLQLKRKLRSSSKRSKEPESSPEDSSGTNVEPSQEMKKSSKLRSSFKHSKEPESSHEDSSDTNVEPSREMKKSLPKVKPLFEFLTKDNSNSNSDITRTPTSKTPKQDKLAQPHITPKTPRQLFMNYEKEKMLRYMECKSYKLNTIKGNKFWQDMEASGALCGRTWHSLRNHFFKTMIFELRRFKLKPEFENKLKQLVGQKR
uniref:TERF2-interacting telomeric protein 1 n=1 Tax=Cacopsylla melanoneura TaxID=428564 RepID=A0A8D9E4E2_9HEMI